MKKKSGYVHFAQAHFMVGYMQSTYKEDTMTNNQEGEIQVSYAGNSPTLDKEIMKAMAYGEFQWWGSENVGGRRILNFDLPQTEKKLPVRSRKADMERRNAESKAYFEKKYWRS